MVLNPSAEIGLRTQVRLVGFRYHPAVGGAEQHARRLMREIASRLRVDVVTVVTSNRSDWLRLLIDGVRDHDDWYEVDGRTVRALARWQAGTRRLMTLISPLYHLPHSPVPTIMARLLARELGDAVAGTDLIHNVFMGREAFSLGLRLAAARAGTPFLFPHCATGARWAGTRRRSASSIAPPTASWR